jgi:hypothetical protein
MIEPPPFFSIPGRKALELAIIKIGCDDLRAFAQERFGNRPADALPRRGHQAIFPLQTISHVALL